MSDGLKLISAMLDVGSSAALAQVSADMFVDNELAVFTYVSNHYRRYRRMPDPATVTEETNVRMPRATESLDFYLDRVIDRNLYNEIRSRFADLRDSMQHRDMDRALATVRAMAQVQRPRRQGEDVFTAGEAMRLSMDRLEETRLAAGLTGVTSGWETLDSITGGYQQSDLVSIVARPSLGKTYLALYQALAAANAGHSVAFITTEMGVEQLGRRILALSSGVNPDLLKRNQLSSHTRRRLGSFVDEYLARDNLRLFPLGMKGSTTAVQAVQEEYMPDIMYIDGMYLLNPMTTVRMKRIEKVAEVLDDLKKINIDYNRPIVAVSQFGRGAGKHGKEGSLETIGYTDAIGTHSSIVLGVKYGPTENPSHSRELEFLKGREGESGSIYTNFRFSPTNFTSFTPDEQAAAEEANLDWMQ